MKMKCESQFRFKNSTKEKSKMKLRLLLIAALAVYGSQAYAGSFQSLTNGNGTTLSAANGGLINGANNPNADALYIQTLSATYLAGYSDTTDFQDGGSGNVIASSITYQTTGASAHSGTLTLLDYMITSNVALLPGVPQATIYDFVYQDSYSGNLVFGSRFLNTVDNNQEFNFTYRYGFSGYTAAAAWTYSTDSDLRMYQAGLTNDHSYAASVAYDGDAVRMKGDYSVSEGNPWSALNLVMTNATSYTVAQNALGFYQAGQEGQAIVGSTIAGFVPTTLVVPVPEPETYGLMLAGLSLVGAAARRRKSK
jgi:hypothetical protein